MKNGGIDNLEIERGQASYAHRTRFNVDAARSNALKSFRRAGVKVGDLLYPVAVSNRRVHLVAQMRVREMVLLGQEDGPSLIDQRFPQFKPWKTLAPTCTDEVIIGIEGSVPRADLEIPSEMLVRLSFRSQRGERPLKYVKNGELTRSIGLHGIYRLSQTSAADLAVADDLAQRGLEGGFAVRRLIGIDLGLDRRRHEGGGRGNQEFAAGRHLSVNR